MAARPTVDVAAARVRLAPLRSSLAAALSCGSAGEVWLVGGVVRDALLGRPLLDVDLVTSRDVETTARTLASRTGGSAFPLGDSFGCWRVAPPTGPTDTSDDLAALQLDICSLRGGSIEADLALRDFTCNAVAVDLAGGDGAPLLDPHGGCPDLEEGALRMVAERSFDDDPLRVLRAARLAHVLGLELEPATLVAARARAPRASEPAGERTFAELRALLLHAEARRGWLRLVELGLEAVLLPELDVCRGLEQSAFHHLDVHDHTLAVLDNCEDVMAAPDFWLPTTDDLEQPTFGDEERLLVLLAALAHDLGKPATRAVRPDGRVSFVGHDRVGAELVDDIAARWRWSGELRRGVARLVGTHLDLGFLLHGDRGARERWTFLDRVAPVGAEAVVLSLSDRLATAGPADRRRWMRAHVQLAREVWNDLARARRDGVPRPLLDGLELAAAAGIEPGPELGVLVTGLAREQAVGAVVDVDGARAWASSEAGRSRDDRSAAEHARPGVGRP